MRIPKYITKQYQEGAHGFRKQKRRQVRLAIKAVDELLCGCAYFPSGSGGIETVLKILREIKKELSVSRFGR